ncbi:hypothetical protein DFH11DRAFT_1722558 [Phellopilus nigrolimitatus]|nr:hypothetical protein DFH11DRAFT_1722558 [Phellopilus nigrolimitatus]
MPCRKGTARLMYAITAPAPVHLGDADSINTVVVPSGAAAPSTVAEGHLTHGTHGLRRPELRKEEDTSSITNVPLQAST